MKLEFIPHFIEGTTKFNGWWVKVTIGKTSCKTWFGSPSETNFDIDYLRGRKLFLIRNSEQLDEFNKLYNAKLKEINQKSLKPTVVYECPHCKQLFKTPNIHDCKKNPEKKNCFSCKWSKGFGKPEIIDYIDVGIGSIPVETIPIECEHPEHKKTGCFDDVDLDIVKNNNYNLQCEGYCQGDYWRDVWKCDLTVPF